jgi:uncharacterized membrane-anchored protein
MSVAHSANKVPETNRDFWVLKLLTTGAGEAVSDWVIKHANQYVAVVVTTVIFIALVALYVRRSRYNCAAYWVTVTMVAITGTQVADILHVALGIPYLVSSVVCVLGVIALFTCWRLVEGSVSMDSIVTRRRELFYWATVIGTFALGTALGDLTALGARWGFGLSAIIFGAIFALPATWWFLRHRNPIATFWFAYIVTRPLGASIADFFAMSQRRGGLNWGLGRISAIWLIFIALGIAVVRHREKLRTAQ